MRLGQEVLYSSECFWGKDSKVVYIATLRKPGEIPYDGRAHCKPPQSKAVWGPTVYISQVFQEAWSVCSHISN